MQSAFTGDTFGTATAHASPGRSTATDGHRLGPGWIIATALVILIVSIHPIRRWHRARRVAATRDANDQGND